jgi:hypothetical protein
MSRLLSLIALAIALMGCRTRAVESCAAEQPLVVQSSPQLVAALQPANAGRHIRILRGDYAVDRPLVVPNGATLEGEGVMTMGPDGLPHRFEAGTATTLRASGSFSGNFVTLGHGSAIRGLRLLDLANPAEQRPLRSGNVVFVGSRAPGDTIAASIVECEIVNPNRAGFDDDGPIGHGIAAVTLNPALGAPPAAHENAQVSVRVRRSIVRAGTGAAVFANNFAARGSVTLRLEGNRFEGYLAASGGVSRPDGVAGSVTSIESQRNLYTRGGFDRHGWLLLGGSTSPHFLDATASGASRNQLHVESTNDRIEGFRTGIQAAAARRLSAQSAALSDNYVELRLQGTHIVTPGEEAADFLLQAALSETGQAGGSGEFPAGDRNVLRLLANSVVGSGPRRNGFAHVVGPRRPANHGTGNRLEIAGDGAAFRQSNRAIEPPPDPQFFVGGR